MKKHLPAPLTATSKLARLPKKIIALKHLLTTPLIEPEALRLFGETCLHSTISTLCNTHGIEFDRYPEKYGVYDAMFTRYHLQPDSRKRAHQLISHYQGRLANA